MEIVGSRPLWSRGSTRLFTAVGAAAIIAAGLFSALTARAPSYHSAWLVAYLVLVVGVTQIVLGVGQSALAARGPRRGLVTAEFVLFVLGNLGVILGTLATLPLVVYAGSLLLVFALVGFAWAVQGSPSSKMLVWAYRLFVVLMIVSVIIGASFTYTATS